MSLNFEEPTRPRSRRLVSGAGAVARSRAASAEPTRTRGTRTDGRKHRVLLVEDDRAIREPLGSLLREEGFEVATAENGQDAFRRLRTEREPDIIVLDLRMPVMDGWEFRAIQKQDPVLALIPVVAISADGSAQALAVSADAYLKKPLDPRDLLQTLDRILLEREWRQMSARLAEAERLAALGRVAAAVGHEINNPLAFVVLNVDKSLADLRHLLEPDLQGAFAPVPGAAPPQRAAIVGAVVAMLEECQGGLERIRRTVGNLQKLSRAEDAERVPIDLRRLIEQSISMAWNQIRHRARLTRELADLPPVQGNGPALGQVFLNLLVNAAQAIPEGHTEENEITVAARVDAGEIVVEVRDTGVGIPPEVLSRVFEPFFTTKPAEVGTGLGLFISRQTVSDHGGRVEIESQPSKGSVFRVFLPLGAAPLSAPAPAPAPWAEHHAPGGRVLVIDDEVPIGLAIRAALRAEHEVVVVQRASDAFARLAAGETFDLMLCDLMMPDVSGPEVYSTIADRWPSLVSRLIFMTGGAFTATTGDFIERGLAPVISKPFRLDDLKKLVRDRVAALRASAREPLA